MFPDASTRFPVGWSVTLPVMEGLPVIRPESMPSAEITSDKPTRTNQASGL